MKISFKHNAKKGDELIFYPQNQMEAFVLGGIVKKLTASTIRTMTITNLASDKKVSVAIRTKDIYKALSIFSEQF